MNGSTQAYTVTVKTRQRLTRRTTDSASSSNSNSTNGSTDTTTSTQTDTSTPPADTTTPASTTTTVTVAPAPTAPAGAVLGAETYKFTKTLKKGSSGIEVTELQNVLRAAGFLKYPTSTGYFGAMTVTAVKAYQTAHKLSAVGFVGPMTRAELNK